MSRSGENILRNRNNSLIVQFLSFPGCPLESRARAELEKALAECGLDRYDNVDVMAEQTADELKAWGSPTILVNGKDVTGHPVGDGVGCRVYSGGKGVPDAQTIVEFLQRNTLDE